MTRSPDRTDGRMSCGLAPRARNEPYLAKESVSDQINKDDDSVRIWTLVAGARERKETHKVRNRTLSTSPCATY